MNNNIQKSPQQKLMETYDFEVNNVDENNLTLLARTAKGATPKNNKPTNATIKKPRKLKKK